MLTKNFERDIRTEVQNYSLYKRLSDMLFNSISEELEHLVVLFDDGKEMEIRGVEGSVNNQLIFQEYISRVNSGQLPNYGNTVDQVLTHVILFSHTHPDISSWNQLSPSASDYNFTRNLSIKIPHYVISPVFICCLDYSILNSISTQDMSFETAGTPLDIVCSFYGRWQWNKLSEIQNGNGKKSMLTKPKYISDQHFDSGEENWLASVTPADNGEKVSNSIGEASLLLDNNGTITLESNWRES